MDQRVFCALSNGNWTLPRPASSSVLTNCCAAATMRAVAAAGALAEGATAAGCAGTRAPATTKHTEHDSRSQPEHEIACRRPPVGTVRSSAAARRRSGRQSQRFHMSPRHYWCGSRTRAMMVANAFDDPSLDGDPCQAGQAHHHARGGDGGRARTAAARTVDAGAAGGVRDRPGHRPRRIRRRPSRACGASISTGDTSPCCVKFIDAVGDQHLASRGLLR